ncbi:MAG: sodium-independent anion transporter, partial [Ectothiorhodospiraceae bacterium]|nr:sodium-independent anion transporter [Ectothiorhodospiraceae bacterium]
MVNRKTLRLDVMAGLTGAIVVLPQGVAFAVIAGMPPEYGLYTAMIPAIIAALFGSSWHLVSGPTTAASLVLFASLSALAEPTTAQYVALAITLTFMVGVTQLVMGYAKLGTLVNFISHSVIIGFTAGAAILIASNQIKHFFGLDIERGLHFYEILVSFAQQLEQINPYVAITGIATLASGILIKRFAPKIPYMIVAMIFGSLVGVLLDSIYGSAVT